VGETGELEHGALERIVPSCMKRGSRVHSRMGGLETWEVKGEDGLR
jgi:hypothetical protein